MLFLVLLVGAVSWLAAARSFSRGPGAGGTVGVPGEGGAIGARSQPPRPGEAAPFFLVELFTSQGCSSCPAADRLLATIARDQEQAGDPSPIHVLSWSITYWNDLGWRDPLSLEQATERQRWYARRTGVGRLITPQLILDGTEPLAGGCERELQRALARADVHRRRAVAVSLRRATPPGAERLGIAYEAVGDIRSASLTLAIVTDEVTTDVLGGENAGRRLEQVAVVRDVVTIPIDGTSSLAGKACFEQVAALVGDGRGHRVVGWVQDMTTGEVLGGASLPLDAPVEPASPTGGTVGSAPAGD